MIEERRQHQRLVPDAPAAIDLANSAPGESANVTLFDVSEGGVGVSSAGPAAENQAVSLTFDLPGLTERIEATAENVWRSDSRSRGGFRFVDLTDAARQHLRDWIASRAYDTAQAPPDLPPNEVIFPAAASEGVMSRLRAALAASSDTRAGRLRRALAVGLAIVVLAPACLYLGHLLGDVGHTLHATEIASVAQASGPALKPIASVAQPHGTEPLTENADLPATLAFDRPGFVVQVAAMVYARNADQLRASLEQKDFPAFVFRRSTSHFFRVAVGPYADQPTAAKIKAQLQSQGFPTILKPWSPE